MSGELHDGSHFNPAGLAIGFGIGIALGVALDNIAIGIAIGTGIGVAFSLTLARREEHESGREKFPSRRGC